MERYLQGVPSSLWLCVEDHKSIHFLWLSNFHLWSFPLGGLITGVRKTVTANISVVAFKIEGNLEVTQMETEGGGQVKQTVPWQ